MSRSNDVVRAHPGLEADLDEVGGDEEGAGSVVVVGRRDGDERDDEQGEGFHLRFFFPF